MLHCPITPLPFAHTSYGAFSLPNRFGLCNVNFSISPSSFLLLKTDNASFPNVSTSLPPVSNIFVMPSFPPCPDLLSSYDLSF